MLLGESRNGNQKSAQKQYARRLLAYVVKHWKTMIWKHMSSLAQVKPRHTCKASSQKIGRPTYRSAALQLPVCQNGMYSSSGIWNVRRPWFSSSPGFRVFALRFTYLSDRHAWGNNLDRIVIVTSRLVAYPITSPGIQSNTHHQHGELLWHQGKTGCGHGSRLIENTCNQTRFQLSATVGWEVVSA